MSISNATPMPLETPPAAPLPVVGSAVGPAVGPVGGQPAPLSPGTPFHFGERVFTFGQEIVELRDSAALLGDAQALRERLHEDGYLYLRGFHPGPAVDAARAHVLAAIAARDCLDPTQPPAAGIASAAQRHLSFFREVEVAHHPAILGMTDGEHSLALFRGLFGSNVITFDKRWLRAMARGGHSHFHDDAVYVGRGTRNRLTMWTAINDIGLDQGGMVLALGSHRHERINCTYGLTDLDLDGTDPVFTTDPGELVQRFGLRLGTARFSAGDVLVFGLHQMHATAPNRSGRYRLSIDTRWQRADEPRDERFFGVNGHWAGNFQRRGHPLRPMRELRAIWGL